ncbi:MAG: hypothetical protein IH919_10895 [Deltaproteobacteria bacterium]|nr:hypothetical protein [Deltaproteobacteria bacterium]
MPIIRAVVAQVRDAQNNVLHEWEGPLPAEVKAAGKRLTIPWVRLNETTFPEPDIGKQAEAFRRDFLRLGNLLDIRENRLDVFAPCLRLVGIAHVDCAILSLLAEEIPLAGLATVHLTEVAGVEVYSDTVRVAAPTSQQVSGICRSLASS